MVQLFLSHSISIADNADNTNNKLHLQIKQISQCFYTCSFICFSVRVRILHTSLIGVSIADSVDNTKNKWHLQITQIGRLVSAFILVVLSVFVLDFF